MFDFTGKLEASHIVDWATDVLEGKVFVLIIEGQGVTADFGGRLLQRHGGF